MHVTSHESASVQYQLWGDGGEAIQPANGQDHIFVEIDTLAIMKCREVSEFTLAIVETLQLFYVFNTHFLTTAFLIFHQKTYVGKFTTVLITKVRL